MQFSGEIAALATAYCWSWTAIFFTAAGIRIGSFSVNVIRLAIACILLSFTTIFLMGTDVLGWYAGGSIPILVLSGVIGLALGDAALFRALILIGPRKTTLIFAITPIITSLIGWIFLNEELRLQSWIAIAVTIVGITYVISERSSTGFKAKAGYTGWGILFALLAALGQAVGLILSKMGMADQVDPLPATLLRIVSGMVILLIYMTAIQKTGLIMKSFTNGKAMLLVFGGSVFGPFAGVWLSVIAVRYTETGIASTLMSTVPIMILPAAYLIYKERITLRTLVGTVIAIGGIAMLFLR